MHTSDLIHSLGAQLKERHMYFATAESCTGGLIAEECTNIAGSSAWFVGGVVAYANHVKHEVLGVTQASLVAYGAVSEAVVREMAEGVCRITKAQCSVAISGIAGPDGGTPDKPVGTVWIACAIATDEQKEQSYAIQAHCFHFTGTRNDVRRAATDAAIAMALQALS